MEKRKDSIKKDKGCIIRSIWNVGFYILKKVLFGCFMFVLVYVYKGKDMIY